MKIFLIMLAMMLTVGIGVSQAQITTDSWEVGFGFDFPRYSSVNITSLNSNYGFHVSLQRNFSEHVGLRFKAGYSHLEGQWIDAFLNPILEKTNLLKGDLDLMYYLVPCAPVSPYLFAGVGGNWKHIINGQTALPDNSRFGSQLNIGAGAEFKIYRDWSVTAEFSYHVTNNSELDGTVVPNELNGRDSYIVLTAGINYFFDIGEPSPQCEPCKGLSEKACTDMTDYNRIEEMIIKHIPKEVIKDIIVDKYIVAVSNDRLVLIGVNFAFDKSDLLPESYPVLDKAVILLNEKPEINVEIEGYTDYIGTDAYNQTLSVERAQTVRAYLISKGINENRLTTIGYGKTNPVADNTTDEGRRMNRRIVFRIIK
jgi:OOP family OmpA-OmpF porin